jgi:hypothetical protein
MRRKATRLGFAAAILAALGFGGTQAAAAPADAEVGICRDNLCETFCQTIGFLGGWCVNDDCFCYID